VAWVTTEELKQAIADTLKIDVTTLQDYWDRIATDSVEEAIADIRAALMVRGFTGSQIETTWAESRPMSRRLALYWSLVKGGGLNAYDDKFVKDLDIRKDLPTMRLVDAGGAAIVPAGLVGHGVMADTPTERVFTDPNSPRGAGSFRPW
jgi:hypothetical protein